MPAVEKVYGDALFEVCKEDDALGAVVPELKAISGILNSEPDFVHLLKSPTVTLPEKEKLLREIFADRVSPVTMNFLLVLTENGRADCFDKILRYVVGLYNDYMNIAEITVTSAMPLSKATEDKIKAKMEQVTKKTVVMTVRVNPELIGGVVISYGNTTIDGSVKQRLADLQNDIAGIIA